ncbi:Lysophospholipid transporter LplT [Planctomycetes bacterium Pan216]|uniref:Lysophospholipid transporter LplT n=1 Tax=Kolteria novifilia TaxID=2527975 RepID=A0A518B5M6_9BACT|nr:Lysophospholipid transporter LplT [Planctomycetes bacterium Pan216]
MLDDGQREPDEPVGVSSEPGNPFTPPRAESTPSPVAVDTVDDDGRPTLFRDPSFWGMNITQFLGAFNDNLFKQLILILAVVAAAQAKEAAGEQGIAMIIFSAPFLLLSGFAGFLSDRYSKRTIVVLSKVAEIVVVALGMVAFWYGSYNAALVVLCLLGIQSSFFGPPKYGILPEMLRPSDLPQANGIMQMSTFLAIIFGTAIAGFVTQAWGDKLWVASGFCLVIAVVGTLTSLLIRPTPVAHPGLRFQVSTLFMNAETRRMLWNDRSLLKVLLFSTLFWFLGGVVQQTVNDYGIRQLQIGKAETSLLVATIAIGIAIGCVTAGKLSAGKIEFRFVPSGALGMCVCMALLALPGFHGQAALVDKWGAGLALVGLGFFAGIFAVPLQVYIQEKPPANQKGRVIGAMNLINWIGIIFSGVFYLAICSVLEVAGLANDRAPGVVFAIASVFMLGVSLLGRPVTD